MKIGDTWFEYDCPDGGIDFDVEPVPTYGTPIECSCCGQTHAADEKIGRAFRLTESGTEDFTAEWANRSTLYTVLRPSGEPEAEGCTVSEAASVVLNYDGGSYEVRRADPKWDVAGEPRWDLWSRSGANGAKWTCTVIGEYAPTEEAAWPLIARQFMLKSAEWRGRCDVISDADYAALELN